MPDEKIRQNDMQKLTRRMREEGDTMIQTDSLSYIYGIGSGYERCALKNINITIQDKEFLAIVGHTGSGKSTLIRQLNALEKPTSGTVYFNGEDIHAKDYDRQKLRSRIGMVFQYAEYQLFEVSVIKDVMFGPLNQGLSEEEAEERAYEALKLVGITDAEMDTSPFALSGGQKRRVAIAGVLAMQPEVLILDEPAAGLDPRGRDSIFQMLRRLHKEREMTIILVSHSMDDVAKLVERMLVMDHGRIVLDGKPKSIFAYRKELEAIGLGIPSVTRILQRIKESGEDIDASAVTVGDAADSIEAWYRKNRNGG